MLTVLPGILRVPWLATRSVRESGVAYNWIGTVPTATLRITLRVAGSITHGNGVFAGQRGKGQAAVQREASLGRTFAGRHLRTLLLAGGVDDRYRATLEIGDVDLLAIRAEPKTMGKLTNRNRRHVAPRCCVDHSDRVVTPIGDIGQATVW